jgi:hypothetical protein
LSDLFILELGFSHFFNFCAFICTHFFISLLSSHQHL